MAQYCSPDYQTSFKSVGLSIQEKKFNIVFEDSGHLKYLIGTILATFDLQVTSILLMEFRMNWLLVQDKVQNKFLTWLLKRPFWISHQIDFNYFCFTSHFLSSFESTGLSVQKYKIDFQDCDCGGHTGFPIRTNLAILTKSHPDTSY